MNDDLEMCVRADTIIEKIDELIATRKYEQIKECILQHKEVAETNNILATVFYLIRVYEQEKAVGKETVFDKVDNVEKLMERYTKLKFYLRRIDFDVVGETITDFYSFLAKERISSYELKVVLDYTVIHRDKVLQVLSG